jgi:hypothetical protein
MSMSAAMREQARMIFARGVPSAIFNRAPTLNGTRFLSRAKARSTAGKPFQLVNIGAGDGVLFDDVTPWLHRIPHARALLVEPIPYNQKCLRENYPDAARFVIGPVAITGEPGVIRIKTFEESAI